MNLREDLQHFGINIHQAPRRRSTSGPVVHSADGPWRVQREILKCDSRVSPELL